MRSTLALAASALFVTAMAARSRPNIVFVLTDDQDAHMDSVQHMPLLNKYIVDHGTTFDRHFCTIAICCPSRVSLWTGQTAHNTNITDVGWPYGGYSRYIEQGYSNKHLSYYLQQAGYNTYYTGKLYNNQSVVTYNQPYIEGYTQAEFLLEPNTYQYNNITSTRNGEPPVTRQVYNTDFLADVTYEFMEEAMNDNEKPFFITVAPIAPHTETLFIPGQDYPDFPPPVPAKRHEHLFKDYKIPRTSNFNPHKPHSVGWIAGLEPLTEDDLEYNDEFQRLRLRSLQAVDEMVEGIVQRLEAAGELDNTYIIYSSDNGFHISQHRLPPGKGCGLETDIRVPLIIRGPGIAAGATRFFPTSHTDLAPTIMKMAGLPIEGYGFDGAPIELTCEPENPPEHVNIEYWGPNAGEGRYFKDAQGAVIGYNNNTYKGLRVETEEYAFYYSVWCTNEKELYDMKADPEQNINLMANGSMPANPGNCKKGLPFGRPLDVLINRLDALTMVLKTCKEESCRKPWGVLHPDGDVAKLSDAMDTKFDEFYATQPKVEFYGCIWGQVLAFEGPMDVNVYTGN